MGLYIRLCRVHTTQGQECVVEGGGGVSPKLKDILINQWCPHWWIQGGARDASVPFLSAKIMLNNRFLPQIQGLAPLPICVILDPPLVPACP